MVYRENNKFQDSYDNDEFNFERKSQKLKFSKKCQDCGKEIKSKDSTLCKSCLKDNYCYN